MLSSEMFRGSRVAQRPSISSSSSLIFSRKRSFGSSSSSSSNKREYFPMVSGPIKYEGPSSTNPLSFRQYNAEEVLLGKSMRDWCRFAVCYWHSFCGVGLDIFGRGTLIQPWLEEAKDLNDPIARGKMKADAAFEFFSKLGVKYYTFHDRDVVDEDGDPTRTNEILHEMADYLMLKQEETGVECLWGTANMFSHPRFMNGAGTNPEVDLFAHAGSQIRNAMDVTHKLGGENYVFWGGREGYSTILNTKIRSELDHAASLFRMAAEYKHSIGANFQLMIEPKPREPTKHQYDYDAMTVIAFLQHYGLDQEFKLNIEPNHTTLAGHDYEHDVIMASEYQMLGSIDCNTGDPLVGWDTDQFLMDDKKATLVMKTVIEQGGLQPGGLNFDCKVRRESTDPVDLFVAHVGSMDTFAKGLRNAVELIESGEMDKMIEERYSSWKNTELGRKIEGGECTLVDLDEYAKKIGWVQPRSGKQELFEMVFHRGCENANMKLASGKKKL